ncbi:polymer-forming cytoskeletal protein [Oryzomicrobium sp.]|uniref:bactofilin family protein n=1 Tax=Oryzomicrobium sp. TaxID=1911578 RepID=UPI0026000F91|nr:polymer-forming cytoskeletal protein [Oryzomicrobium sp.]MCE1243179.1 polymer-forming cytoskeletal protein [Oryzomicrobium sp.]
MLNKQSFFGKREETAPLRNDALAPRDTRLSGASGAAVAAPVGLAPLGTPGRAPAGPATASSPLNAADAGKSAAKPGLTDAVGGNRLIVGPDVKLKGAEILDCDTLVVEGRVEATMDSRVMHIAEKGVFSGKVSIDVAEVYGTFEGELTARQQLVIHETGRVSGTIRYGKILIDEGGELSGDIKSLDADTPVLTRAASAGASVSSLSPSAPAAGSAKAGTDA